MEQAPQNELMQKRETHTGRQRGLAIAICAVLGAPFLYMGCHTSPGSPANTAAPTPATNDPIPALEAATRAQPTEANELNLSLAYLNANRPSDALPVLQHLLAQYPSDAKAWNNLCVAHNLKSEFSEAIDTCHRALELDPGFQLAQNNLRWAEAQKQKALAAIAAAEALPPAARTSASFLNEGLDQLHAGQYDQALDVWRKLAAREPNNALAVNNVGVAYMMKHDPAHALPWFEKALALDPTGEMARNNLAWARSEMQSATTAK